jgi:hypothetical protein
LTARRAREIASDVRPDVVAAIVLETHRRSVVVEEPAADATDALDLAARNGLLESLRRLGLAPGVACLPPTGRLHPSDASP